MLLSSWSMAFFTASEYTPECRVLYDQYDAVVSGSALGWKLCVQYVLGNLRLVFFGPAELAKAVMSYDTPAKKLGIKVAESTSATIHATIIKR